MDYDTLEVQLKAKLNAAPSDAAAASALGNHYFDKKNTAAAIACYQLSLRNDANQPSVMTDMGTMYWQNQDTGIAKYYFSTVVENFPEFGNAYINLGLLYLHVEKDAQQAESLWQRLLDNYPQHSAAAKARELIQDLNK